jgi:hypothetical protein
MTGYQQVEGERHSLSDIISYAGARDTHQKRQLVLLTPDRIASRRSSHTPSLPLDVDALRFDSPQPISSLVTLGWQSGPEPMGYLQRGTWLWMCILRTWD